MHRILLIELRSALEAAGYDVFAVSDGRSGVEAQRRAPADVVVTDLYMPDMDGLETIAFLRREYPALKIIAMSGGSRLRGMQANHLEVARVIGADRALRKPFDPCELIAAVRQVLG